MRRPAAFTLIEVVMSLAIVATVFVALVGLMGYALKTTRTVLAKDEVFKLASVLESSLLEEDFGQLYEDFVDPATDGERRSLALCYFYWGTPGPSTDPVPPASRAGAGGAEKIGVARRKSSVGGDFDARFDSESVALEGGVYWAELTLSDANPWAPDPGGGDPPTGRDELPSDPADYPEAILVLHCRFFEVGPGAQLPEADARPIYATNIGVLR